ncbi:hypothetical protein WDL1CHR_05203 [Variovorax sp. WDL1]|nr:hypothetical protein CHC06_07229 [Variovorax sp. B2]PNG48463.1 hypothetical protein CHC07_07639 [Variovorax sp. B4]VTV14712.1 hypothetical protein WDL1CHR_05203 [Variovorax sp. WDL1]
MRRRAAAARPVGSAWFGSQTRSLGGLGAPAPFKRHRAACLGLDFADAPPARLATPADHCLLADLGHRGPRAGAGRRRTSCPCGASLARGAASSPRRWFGLARQLGRIRSTRCRGRVSERCRGHVGGDVPVSPEGHGSALRGQRARTSLAAPRRPSTTSSTDDLKNASARRRKLRVLSGLQHACACPACCTGGRKSTGVP